MNIVMTMNLNLTDEDVCFLEAICFKLKKEHSLELSIESCARLLIDMGIKLDIENQLMDSLKMIHDISDYDKRKKVKKHGNKIEFIKRRHSLFD